MITFKQKQYSEEEGIFLEFLGVLSGFVLKSKVLHWSAPKKNIHQYLDELFDALCDFQDTVAEGYMGILGKMGPNDVPYTPCQAGDSMEFINEVIMKAKEFYERIPEEVEFKGLTSETETFIQTAFKYRYLFSLCDNNYEGDETH